MAFGVMFHYFHDDVHHLPSQGSLDADQLDTLIGQLKRHYNVLCAADWQQRALTEQLEPTDICLTFDDGLQSQWDVALPVLQQHQLTAFWFVNTSMWQGDYPMLEVYRHFRHTAYPTISDFYTDFQQALTLFLQGLPPDMPADYLAAYPFYSWRDRQFRYWRDEVLDAEQYDAIMQQLMAEQAYTPSLHSLWLGPNQIRQLDQTGHVVGLHSHTHPTQMDLLPIVQQQAEYQQNSEALTPYLGTQPLCMAHPSDRYTMDTLTLLTAMGLKLGFCAHPDTPDHPLTRPRYDVTQVMRLPVLQ